MQGECFDKRKWDGKPLPDFAAIRGLLPDPIYEDDDAVAAYWRSWELAIASMKSPQPGSGFVSNHLYMEFSNSIFAHDTTIMVLFARYGFRAFSAAESFDNFYARQHETGEICREIRLDGEDYWPNKSGSRLRISQTQDGKDWYEWTPPYASGEAPRVAVEGLNDPSAMLWGEWASYEITGDRERLRRILSPQEKWFEAFERFLKDTNGLYVTDWASADNTPRNGHDLAYGVDVASQQAYFARLLAQVHDVVGNPQSAARYRQLSKDISDRIAKLMWNESAGFYFDLNRRGEQIRIKSALAFNPMLTDAAGPSEVRRLVEHLNNSRTFNRPVRVPSLAADEKDYCPVGGYLIGGVWPFINAMILLGLERHGRWRLAREIALNHWQAHVTVFRDTGTVWEFLQPEKAEPGGSYDPRNPGCAARRDFAGWGAWSPICHLLEYAIGLRPHAPSNTLTWNLHETRRCGCRNYAFGQVVADLECEPRKSESDEPVISVKANGPFTLVVNWGDGKTRTINVK